MRIYNISRDIMKTAPYPGDPIPLRKQIASIDICGYNLSAIRMSVHAATHVDAPLHYFRNGKDITNIDLSCFIGTCSVITVPQKALDAMFFMNLKISERLILRGNGILTKSGIGYLYNRGVKLVGTDRETIGTSDDEMTAHIALLGYGIVVLENLDLSAVPDGEYFLSAAPILISGAEAAPCRAILVDGILN